MRLASETSNEYGNVDGIGSCMMGRAVVRWTGYAGGGAMESRHVGRPEGVWLHPADTVSVMSSSLSESSTIGKIYKGDIRKG